MFKRLVFALLVASLVLSAATLFASGAQESKTKTTAGKEPVTLSFVYRTGGNLEAVSRDAIERLEKANPNIKIDFQQPAGDIWTNLKVMLAAGDTIDLAAMDDEIYPSFADTGLLTDLKPYMEKEIDLKDFIPSSLAVYDWFGKYYALPFTGAGVCLFYNKAIFDENGLQGPPETAGYMWDKFLADMRKVTRDKNNDGKIDVFGFALNTWWPYPQTWLWRNGGGIYNKDMTQVTIDSKAAKDALQFYADLRVKYKVAPSLESHVGFVS